METTDDCFMIPGENGPRIYATDETGSYTRRTYIEFGDWLPRYPGEPRTRRCTIRIHR